MYCLHCFYLWPSSVINFKRWTNVFFIDFRGSEIACDAIPHIDTPLSISFVFLVNDRQTQNQPLSGKKTHHKFSSIIHTFLTTITSGVWQK